MDFKAFDKAQGNFLFEGQTDRIEEGIVFVRSDALGFGVLRILGDQINPASLLSLSKKTRYRSSGKPTKKFGRCTK